MVKADERPKTAESAESPPEPMSVDHDVSDSELEAAERDYGDGEGEEDEDDDDEDDDEPDLDALATRLSAKVGCWYHKFPLQLAWASYAASKDTWRA